jgi:DNA polymerase I-like protein with 3'-5' exonuclease and polymerase domains
VHDQLMFEVRDDVGARVVPVVRGIMQGHASGVVPLVVDVETGPAWGSLEKYAA